MLPGRITLSAAIASATFAGHTATTATAATSDLRLGHSVVPTAERIELVLDADKPDYTGRVHIDLDVRESVREFRLHAEDMTLDRITLVPAANADDPAAALTLTPTTGTIGLVTLAADRPLTPGAWVLRIDFANQYNTDATGLYRMQQDGAGYLFTQFEADDARQAFPCFDEPEFKIPWEMTIEVPPAHIAVFNTPVAEETRRPDRRRVVFAKSKPMPSYLLAIATGPLETVDIPDLGVPGRVITVRGQKHLAALAVQTTPPLLRAAERWFGQKYPYEKLDLLAVPEYWAGAMENPGAITYAANVLLVDSAAASVQQRRTLVRISAHELAHMWFGDLVTMRWWDDLWLNESFADWLGDKLAHEVYPEFRLDVTELSAVHNVMTNDARPSAQAIQRPIEPGDNLLENVGTQYNKGKAVLGMFEGWIGAETFQRGVREYLRAHAWGNASADDLWAALGRTSGQDLTSAMQTFLSQPSVPTVRARLLDDGRLELAQERTLNLGTQAEPLRWKIPVTVRWSDGGTVRTRTFLLDEPQRTFALESRGAVRWLLPNADALGYYRWSVPAAQWTALLEHTSELATRERIDIVSNTSALLNTGAIHGDDLLRTLARFRDDPDPLVISALVDALGKVHGAFVPDDLRDAFAPYVRETLGPALSRVGFDRKPDEAESVSLVRPSLVSWLGDHGQDPDVRARAATIARHYVEAPQSVDPALAATCLHLAALDGDRALFDTYRTQFETAKVPAVRSRYLGSLGYFRDPALVEAALRYALEGPLRPQELFSVTQGITQTESGRDRAFRWMTENYATLVARIPGEFAGFLPGYGSCCDLQRLEAAQAFFNDPEHQARGTVTTLAKVSDASRDCARLREREGASVAAYLQSAVGQR
jgi:alanyl aminopeptidase